MKKPARYDIIVGLCFGLIMIAVAMFQFVQEWGSAQEARTRVEETVFRNGLTTQVAGGATLNGCGGVNGWIENTGQYPIRVQTVWQTTGENTLAVTYFLPGEKKLVGQVSGNHGFYVYTERGIMVGWISGVCPK